MVNSHEKSSASVSTLQKEKFAQLANKILKERKMEGTLFFTFLIL